MVRTKVTDMDGGDAHDFDNGDATMAIEEVDERDEDILNMFDEGDEDWADDLRIIAYSGDTTMG